MGTEEQIKYLQKVETRLKDKGTTKKHFFEKVKISRTQWHFLLKGERILTAAKKLDITQFFRNW